MNRPPLYEVMERVRFRQWFGALYRIAVHGGERIPATGPVILVANHECVVDPWILGLATPRPIRYMAKAELWRYRPIRWAMEQYGTFPVERGTGDLTAVSRAAELLREGEVLGIFPQGTSRQLPSRPFHRGAARLALATGAPLVPVRMTNTRGIPYPGRRRVEIHVGEPIHVEPAKPTVAAARELTQRVKELLVA